MKLVNSLPKSGTHLLGKALVVLGLASASTTRSIPRRATDRLGLTPPAYIERRSAQRWGRARFWADRNAPDERNTIPVGVFTPYFVSPGTLQRWLKRSDPSKFLLAHIPYTPETAQIFDATNTRSIAIIRDPRAVAASMIPYILDARQYRHFLQDYFEGLNEDERVDFAIHGGFADPPGIPVRSLADAIASILNWDRHPGTLIVRFEDLVGLQGGGSVDALETTLRKIADHLGIEFTSEIRSRMGEVFDPSSPTFRGGKIDSWRERLTADQISRVEASVGRALFERAGYALDGR